MAEKKRKLRRNDIKRSKTDLTTAENAKLEKETIRYQKQENRRKAGFSETGHKNTVRRRRIEESRKKDSTYKAYSKMNRGERIQQRKLEFRKRAVMSLSGVLLALGMVVLLIWHFSFESIDLKDYISISYDGYDSHGTAYPRVNALGKNSMFLAMLNCQILTGGDVENGQLENGDRITVEVDYDKKLAKEWKLRVKNAQIETEVMGLSEGEEISMDELFQNVLVSYEGIAPELKVQISNENTTDYLKDIQYEIIDEKEFYDINDTFQVRANIHQEDAVKNGFAIEPTEAGYCKEYKIENRDCYFRDSNEITAKQIKELNQTAAKLFGDANEYGLRIFSEANLMPIWVNNKLTFTWSNPRLQSAYFNVLKPEYFGRTEVHDNDVKLVYLVTLQQADGVSCQTQVVVRFTDLVKRMDGTVDLALDSGKIIAASYRKSNIKELVSDAYNEEYESIKLDLDGM